MDPYGTYRSPARLSPIALRVLRPSHRCALRAHRRHPHRGRRRPFARAHLSLQPPHRRGWGSLYAALSHGRIGEEALRRLLAGHPLAGAEGKTPVYAVDISVWARQRRRRNRAGDRPEGQKAASRVEPSATRPSKRAPEPAKTANGEFCDGHKAHRKTPRG